jgi:hypothetical protein
MPSRSLTKITFVAYPDVPVLREETLLPKVVPALKWKGLGLSREQLQNTLACCNDGNR